MIALVRLGLDPGWYSFFHSLKNKHFSFIYIHYAGGRGAFLSNLSPIYLDSSSGSTWKRSSSFKIVLNPFNRNGVNHLFKSRVIKRFKKSKKAKCNFPIRLTNKTILKLDWLSGMGLVFGPIFCLLNPFMMMLT